MHSGYITKHLRSTTKERLLDNIAGYNEGYDGSDALYYRRIPADILAKIHRLEAKIKLLHDQKQLLMMEGWERGRAPADLTKLMDKTKHKVNGDKLRKGDK